MKPQATRRRLAGGAIVALCALFTASQTAAEIATPYTGQVGQTSSNTSDTVSVSTRAENLNPTLRGKSGILQRYATQNNM